MDNWSVFDYIFNVCRSVSDVLHIACYALLVTVAILFAAHKFGSTTYIKHVYDPFTNYLVKKGFAIRVKTRMHGRSIPRVVKLTIWVGVSNRLPYIIKRIKKFFDRFK